jgi:preprotein translocase subunit SecB
MDITAKIITQFVKDLSFENPKGPSGFQSKDEKPAINAQVDVKATNQKDTSIYEVELNISVSAARVDEQVYIVDLKYVGIFEIENLTDDIKEAYLLVECPRQLFPFARRIIYDLHADGALPPLMLDPVNFADLYQKKKKAAN